MNARTLRAVFASHQDELLRTLKHLPVPDAERVIAEGFRMAAAELKTTRSRERSISSEVGALPGESDITDEINRGGPAFGEFVRSIGLAVADAQTKLDATLTTTAKALSDTLIDVIAIYEQQIDNDGQMEKGNALVQKLPLINYLMPTAYQWTRVFLQADMKVSEFNAANGMNVKGKSQSFTAGASASYGITGFGASGSARYANSSFDVSATTTVAQDAAAGSLHMEATLEPRPDVQLPRPFILQKGPRLTLTSSARTDIMNTATPPAVVGRKVTLTATLLDAQNKPLQKTLEVRISDPALNYAPDPSNGTTDTAGQLKLEIKRENAAFDAAKPAQPVLVRVWLGLITQEIGINI
jgi:hypothetical protein